MTRTTSLVALLALAAPLLVAGAGTAAPVRSVAAAAVDDPPPTPEPADCPLCGGDIRAHEARTRAIVRLWAEIGATALILR